MESHMPSFPYRSNSWKDWEEEECESAVGADVRRCGTSLQLRDKTVQLGRVPAVGTHQCRRPFDRCRQAICGRFSAQIIVVMVNMDGTTIVMEMGLVGMETVQKKTEWWQCATIAVIGKCDRQRGWRWRWYCLFCSGKSNNCDRTIQR